MPYVIDLHKNHGVTWFILHKGIALLYYAIVTFSKRHLILLNILTEGIFCYCILHN